MSCEAGLCPTNGAQDSLPLREAVRLSGTAPVREIRRTPLSQHLGADLRLAQCPGPGGMGYVPGTVLLVTTGGLFVAGSWWAGTLCR